MELEVTIPGLVVPYRRHETVIRGLNAQGKSIVKRHSHKTDAATAWMRTVAIHAKEAMKENGWSPLQGPVQVSGTIFVPVPKRTTKRAMEEIKAGTRLPCVTPDIDNCLKCLLDSIKNVMFDDDKFIVRYKDIEKVYGRWSRVRLSIRQMEPSRCQIQEWQKQ